MVGMPPFRERRRIVWVRVVGLGGTYLSPSFLRPLLRPPSVRPFAVQNLVVETRGPSVFQEEETVRMVVEKVRGVDAGVDT